MLLEYPNGRTLEATVSGELRPGDEFEMHGRSWQAVKALPRPPKRFSLGEPTRMLCRSTGRLLGLPSDPRD